MQFLCGEREKKDIYSYKKHFVWSWQNTSACDDQVVARGDTMLFVHECSNASKLNVNGNIESTRFEFDTNKHLKSGVLQRNYDRERFFAGEIYWYYYDQ